MPLPPRHLYLYHTLELVLAPINESISCIRFDQDNWLSNGFYEPEKHELKTRSMLGGAFGCLEPIPDLT